LITVRLARLTGKGRDPDPRIWSPKDRDESDGQQMAFRHGLQLTRISPGRHSAWPVLAKNQQRQAFSTVQSAVCCGADPAGRRSWQEGRRTGRPPRATEPWRAWSRRDEHAVLLLIRLHHQA